MSLPKTEALFRQLSTSDDAEIIRLIGEWEPAFRHRKRDEGNLVIAELKRHGIDACLAVTLSHDRINSLAIEAVKSADLTSAASAFIHSTNPVDDSRTQWLNPLRAISILRQLPKHRLRADLDDDEEESPYDQCVICGELRQRTWMPMSAANDLPSGYSGEDFEIFKQTMIVRWCNRTATPAITRNDEKAFKRFLKVIAEASGKATALQVSRVLAKKIGGFAEWSFHLEALAFAGILKTSKQPGNLQKWTDFNERKKTSPEVPAPMCHWRRHMGFDAGVFHELFPKIALPNTLRAPPTT